ncbi:MAG: DEAD/DEAH box helicase [Nanoarchaeota archaeon]|nr:DEAD/DEAH box helicase [Nanoarchaeota archaeon]MBU1269811.1 DEAD/DEAH box helicase [Nanoarchaeota archaeon]MBU1604282.1 DEAD/DEAH box helicase [Nanoarchaeota archaeon]MBU2442444.1 DEAD/DEAH box helicase [Nanoarchaeota archaeon]
MTFELMNIRKEIVNALKEEGIINPTKIQQLAIPLIKSGKDVIGMSNTGSGKTVAFGVPILEKIVPRGGLQVLIMVPTRELAVQIGRELEKFSKYMHASIATVFGGVAIGPQMDKLQRAEIVVGTTGRLVDHLHRGTLNLSKLTCVILDEADKMIEMGFIEDIEELLKRVPKNKQVLLFGATISDEINNIKHRHMNDPEIAKADTYVKDDFLEQYYYDVKPNEKFSLLVHLLKKEEMERVLVFCATIATVEILAKNLRAQGVKAEMIHGKLTQNKRLSIIENFNKGKTNILIASAVAARGLDIRNISHVINYSLSKDAEEYIHRVGRTARAGDFGKAITLLEPKDHEAFGHINSRFSVNIKKLPKEAFPQLTFNARENMSRSRDGGFNRGRGGNFNRDKNNSFNRGEGNFNRDRNSGFNRGRSTSFNKDRNSSSNHEGGNSSSGRNSGFNRGRSTSFNKDRNNSSNREGGSFNRENRFGSSREGGRFGRASTSQSSENRDDRTQFNKYNKHSNRNEQYRSRKY